MRKERVAYSGRVSPEMFNFAKSLHKTSKNSFLRDFEHRPWKLNSDFRKVHLSDIFLSPQKSCDP